jgi:hypothetical protein
VRFIWFFVWSSGFRDLVFLVFLVSRSGFSGFPGFKIWFSGFWSLVFLVLESGFSGFLGFGSGFFLVFLFNLPHKSVTPADDEVTNRNPRRIKIQTLTLSP